MTIDRMTMARAAVTAMGVALASSGAAAQTPHDPQPRPVIVDSNGKLIGFPTTGDAAFVTVTPTDVTAVPVRTTGFFFKDEGALPRIVYYDNINCIGKPYLADRGFETRAHLTKKGVLVYPDTRNPLTIQYKSRLFQGQCSNISAKISVFPMKKVAFDYRAFTPPFHIDIR